MANFSSIAGKTLQAGGAALPYLLGGPAGAIGGASANLLGSLISSYSASNPQQQQSTMQPQAAPQGQSNSPLSQGPENTLLYQKFSPQQQQALNQLLSSSMSGLSQQNAGFAPIRENALRSFDQQGVPSILDRIRGISGSGASSGKTQILAQARKDLESELGGQEAQYNLSQQQLLQNLLGLGLTPQTDVIYKGNKPSFWESLGTGAAAGGVAALPGLLKGSGSSFMDLFKSLLQSQQQQPEEQESPAEQAGAVQNQVDPQQFQQVLDSLKYLRMAPQPQFKFNLG
jgi:hypothetical protein